MAFTLEMARDIQASYEPTPEILDAIKQKTLIAVVGPAGSGKSTTMDEVARLDANFGRTGSYMTRDPRPEDDPRFSRYTTQEAMLRRIAERSLVQYVVHPTTGHIYSTDLSMYEHHYNMLETLPTAISDMRRLQFGKLVITSIVSEADAWQQWFEVRYPVHDDEQKKRVEEAVANLQWSIAQPEDTINWLENIPGRQTHTAQQLIKIAQGAESSDLKYMANDMLAVAKAL